MSDVKNLPLNSILESIKTIQNANVVKIHVPTLNKAVSFLPLSALQQKNLIKTSLQQKRAIKVDFIKTLNDIIKLNCQEHLDLNSINSLDRICISIGLRINAVGPSIKIADSDVDLTNVLDKLTKIDQSLFKNVKISLDKDTFAILNLYSIEKDFSFSKLVDEKIKNSEDVGFILSEIFFAEIAKYLESYTATIDSESVTYNLNEYRNDEVMRLLSMLPSIFVNKMFKEVEKYKKTENEILTFGEHKLEIDGQFFTAS